MKRAPKEHSHQYAQQTVQLMPCKNEQLFDVFKQTHKLSLKDF